MTGVGALRILLVEDDDRVAAALRPALLRHGMSMDRLPRGREVESHLGGIDVVLLDLGLPDIDGVDVCRAIRAHSDLPIIIVSARGEVDDRILGLHCGADDYLVKPYDVNELVARVEAVYRRRRASVGASAAGGEVVEVDGVRVDLARHTVSVAGQDVLLTRKEFQVLGLLATAGGAVCTRGRIVAEVWGRTRCATTARGWRRTSWNAPPTGAGAARRTTTSPDPGSAWPSRRAACAAAVAGSTWSCRRVVGCGWWPGCRQRARSPPRWLVSFAWRSPGPAA